MKNEKWFKDILSEVKFADGFPMAKFYYHPLYRVGVGKDTNLDYTFGKKHKIPWKNLRKFKFFTFNAPFPSDSVIFFQPGRERLIISSQKEGKVLKISISSEQLSLLEGEIKELKFQNQSAFAKHSVKFLDSGPNWILTSFCSNLDSVTGMPILDLHDLLLGPMTTFYMSNDFQKVTLENWCSDAAKRALGHPDYNLIISSIDKVQQGDAFELVKGKLHFDLHSGNVLRDGEQVVIIDWEVSYQGLLLIDYFDFFRRHVNQGKIGADQLIGELRGTGFFKKFQEWMNGFDILVPDNTEKQILMIYALERTLIYHERWNEDRLSDKRGFETKLLKSQ